MRLLPILCLVVACAKPAAPSPEQPKGQTIGERPAHAWSFADTPSPTAPIKIAVGAPIGLTASDGTGLGIVSIKANAVVDAPLAFTELHIVFDNPRAQQIEGQFRITLPERASVSRFAMLTHGAWQEGEVVERQAARRAYEDFLHRRQDPALLEQQAGNEFSARIFPIPPRGQKEVVIAYSEELLGDRYRIALTGLPEVGAIDVHVNEGDTVSELHQHAYTPDKDFDVLTKQAASVALRKDNLVVARVTPVTDAEEDKTDSLFLLIDTSASRTLGKASDAALAKDLLSRLGDAPVAVWAFDQTTLLVDEGKASAISWKKLDERRSLGASNLEQALATIAKHDRKYRRGLLISDGVVTAGNESSSAALKATGIQRFDAIAVGGIRDRDALQRMVFGGGLVIDGALPSTAIATKLNHKTRSGIKVDVPGADWVWPSELDGVQPGDPVLIYADLGADKSFSLALDGKGVAAGTVKATPRPLLERAWVAARIKKLLDQKERTTDQDMRSALTKEVVELSTTHRVLCPLTALLVLETEEDYRRFHIDRKALAGILSIDKGKVVVTGRNNAVVVKAAKPMAPPKMTDSNEAPIGQAEAGRQPRMDASRGGGGAPAEAESGLALAKSASADKDDDDAMDEKKMSRREESAMGQASRGAAAPAPASPRPPPASTMAAPAADEAPRSNAITAESLAPPAPSSPVIAERTPPDPPTKTETINPYTGQFRAIMSSIRHKQNDEALAQADGWWQTSPGDVMALVALGEALEASSQIYEAARAYGSLIDLFSARADIRRFAGQRLERLKSEAALALAADSYAKAVAQRPDHPQSHRLLAYTLLKLGQAEKAFDVLEKGSRQRYPDGRFAGVDQILSEDLGLAAQAWIKAAPERKDEIYARLAKDGGRRETAPSLRFVLSWETDANDVDFHIFDSKGGHAFYSQKELESGGELYADVTTGYGPECFTIRGKPHAAPYKLQAHYYSRGPMGYGMGKLEIVQHDGQGNLKFDERPFVVMQDQAFLDLGSVGRTL